MSNVNFDSKIYIYTYQISNKILHQNSSEKCFGNNVAIDFELFNYFIFKIEQFITQNYRLEGNILLSIIHCLF